MTPAQKKVLLFLVFNVLMPILVSLIMFFCFWR